MHKHKTEPKIFWFFLLIFFISSFSLLFADESITITTYYPSPYGSYRELSWGGSGSRGKLKSDSGSSIELGGSPTAPEVYSYPYIDFSNDNDSNNDYDVRIRLLDDDHLIVEGGTITGAVSCTKYTFTATSGSQECPAGYAIPMAPFAPTDTSGTFLCCQYQ